MNAMLCEDRQILRISGEDRLDFLQGLVTNDVAKLENGLVYAAMLTPQGKYLADFFMLAVEDAVLLDVKIDLSAGLAQRLSLYKLRAKVVIEPLDMQIYRGRGDMPKGALADPRHGDLGWRHYGALEASADDTDWTVLRIAHMVPETNVELIPNDSYILEHGFEALKGVDFRKGCYVGQEVTARMKHKTELRKGLVQVRVEGEADAGTEITANGKAVGILFSQAGGLGLAYLRLERAGLDMTAGEAAVHYSKD